MSSVYSGRETGGSAVRHITSQADTAQKCGAPNGVVGCIASKPCKEKLPVLVTDAGLGGHHAKHYIEAMAPS